MGGLGEARDELAAHALAGALIGDGGVGEAVADDEVASGERGLDDARHVVGARREHEQRLEDRRHRLGEDRLPQALGELRAAGLARHDDVRALRAHRVGDEFDVGRFAGAVDAFQRQELHRPPRSWYFVTARLCSSIERENWLVPSPRET